MSTDPSSSSPHNSSSYPPLPNHYQPDRHHSHSPTTTHVTFRKGQSFPSLRAFKESVRHTAFAQHWEPSVANSNKSKVQIKCRSSDTCPFKVWCRVDAKTGLAIISNVDNTHSCRGAPLADRNQGSRIRFLEQEIPKLLDLRSGGVSGQKVVEAIKAAHGFEISIRQAQRALRSLKLGDMERSYAGIGGGDDEIGGGGGMDLDISMDAHSDDELSQMQTTQHQQHSQHPHQHQYPPPPQMQPSPMAPRILHHHQTQQPSPRQPFDHHPHALQAQGQQSMGTPQPPGWVLKTPSGRTITGPPHELIMYLQGAMDSMA